MEPSLPPIKTAPMHQTLLIFYNLSICIKEAQITFNYISYSNLRCKS